MFECCLTCLFETHHVVLVLKVLKHCLTEVQDVRFKQFEFWFVRLFLCVCVTCHPSDARLAKKQFAAKKLCTDIKLGCGQHTLQIKKEKKHVHKQQNKTQAAHASPPRLHRDISSKSCICELANDSAEKMTSTRTWRPQRRKLSNASSNRSGPQHFKVLLGCKAGSTQPCNHISDLIQAPHLAPCGRQECVKHKGCHECRCDELHPEPGLRLTGL